MMTVSELEKALGLMHGSGPYEGGDYITNFMSVNDFLVCREFVQAVMAYIEAHTREEVKDGG